MWATMTPHLEMGSGGRGVVSHRRRRCNKAERYTCTLFNNATAVLSIHVAIRTWTFGPRSSSVRRVNRRDVHRSYSRRTRLAFPFRHRRRWCVSSRRSPLPALDFRFRIRERKGSLGETLTSVSAALFSIIHEEITRLQPISLAANVR